MLRIIDLAITYPRRMLPVVKDINFELPNRSICLIYGQNGSGKTSLCLALAGLIQHASPEAQISGTVEWDGRVLSQKEFNAEVGVTLENPYAQISGVKSTVESEIAFGLEMRGVPPYEIKRLIHLASSVFDITHLLSRAPHTLSGGETQRVVLACSYVLSPAMWILDRPLTELDPTGRNRLLNILKTLAFQTDSIIILADEPSIKLDSIATHRLSLDTGKLTRMENVLVDSHDDSNAQPLVSSVQFQRTSIPFDKGKITPHLVDIQNLSFRYAPDSPLIFDHLNITIDPGECLWITGPNGCGKTTLAKLIMGILKPEGGRIMIKGSNSVSCPLWENAMNVSYAFQNPDYQIFSTTVWDEVSFGPKSLGYPPHKIDSLTDNALNLFNLSEQKQVHPHDLTRSERKRLGLASTFAMDTPILILDEPTQYQDTKEKKVIFSGMKEALGKGKSILCITHDMISFSNWG